MRQLLSTFRFFSLLFRLFRKGYVGVVVYGWILGIYLLQDLWLFWCLDQILRLRSGEFTAGVEIVPRVRLGERKGNSFHVSLGVLHNVKVRDHIPSCEAQFLCCSFNDYIKYRSLVVFDSLTKSGVPSLLSQKFSFLYCTQPLQVYIPKTYKSCFAWPFVVSVAHCWNRLSYKLRFFSYPNNHFHLKPVDYFRRSTIITTNIC